MPAPFANIRHRTMCPNDVRECVELVAAHPVHGPRYGKAIADLPAAWLRLLSSEVPHTCAVIVKRTGARDKIVAVGASAFVSDAFIRELKAAPSFWIGTELTKRTVRGDSPVLTPKQEQEANSRGGLNLAVWQGTISPEEMQSSDVGRALLRAFLETHQGYLLKELLGQAESLGQFHAMIDGGGRNWNFATGRYGKLRGNPEEIIRKPHFVGLTSEIAAGRPGSWGSWVGTLFLYRRPQAGFSLSEQRLLLSALDGSTDEELRKKLNLSLTTVKKTWRSIYDRVADRLPDLAFGNERDKKGPRERGKTKKQRLLAYLREHLEELRPTSRKLLS